jgi:hypothetical protein
MKVYLDRDREGDDGELILEFEGAEKELLLLSLVEMREQYELDPEMLPEPLRRYWDGTLSVSAKGELAEASDDLRDARLGWRHERLRAVERWLAPDGGLVDGTPRSFVLDEEEIDLFFCVLNDRRLTLAALHGIDDGRMEENPADVQDRNLQRALWEIHFLAFVMENCLQALRDEEEE